MVKEYLRGGKRIPAREFGNGGRIYLCSIELGGGSVSGDANFIILEMIVVF